MRAEKYRDDEFKDTRSDQREHPRAERQIKDEARRRIDEIAPATDSGFTPPSMDAPVDGGCGGE